MSREEHLHCDYCGKHLGHAESHSEELDINDKLWCGECSHPDYAFYDMEHPDTKVGVVKDPYPDRDDFWNKYYIPENQEKIREHREKTTAEDETR